MSDAIGRPVDVVAVNDGHPEGDALERYGAEQKELLQIGDVPNECEVITGDFWQGQIARHARRRLVYAVWSALSDRLLSCPQIPIIPSGSCHRTDFQADATASVSLRKPGGLIAGLAAFSTHLTTALRFSPLRPRPVTSGLSPKVRRQSAVICRQSQAVIS